MNIRQVKIASNCRTLEGNTRLSARRGAMLGIVLLVVGALIFASGCSSSSTHKITAAAQNVYVTQADSVLIFPITASGNVAPTTTISGTNTTITDPHHSAFDTAGNLYLTSSASNSVLVYPPSASGNVAPTTTISGANTGFDFPNGIALDTH